MVNRLREFSPFLALVLGVVVVVAACQFDWDYERIVCSDDTNCPHDSLCGRADNDSKLCYCPCDLDDLGYCDCPGGWDPEEGTDPLKNDNVGDDDDAALSPPRLTSGNVELNLDDGTASPCYVEASLEEIDWEGQEVGCPGTCWPRFETQIHPTYMDNCTSVEFEGTSLYIGIEGPGDLYWYLPAYAEALPDWYRMTGTGDGGSFSGEGVYLTNNDSGFELSIMLNWE